MKRILAAAALLIAASSQASVITGQQLLDMLQSSNPVETNQAMGYIVGAYDANAGLAHCAPAMRVTAIIDTVKAYLVSNPQVRGLGADLLVTMKMSSLYPCARPAVSPSPSTAL